MPGPSTPQLICIEPAAAAAKKTPINTVYLNSLLTQAKFQGEISFDQLTFGKKLGSGGFKDCYAGTYRGVRSSDWIWIQDNIGPFFFSELTTHSYPVYESDLQEEVAIGELRVQNFTEVDIAEMKHEIDVLK